MKPWIQQPRRRSFQSASEDADKAARAHGVPFKVGTTWLRGVPFYIAVPSNPRSALAP
jgi:hypothetical protein